MALDRRHVKTGLVALGLAAGLAGGGLAVAAATPAFHAVPGIGAGSYAGSYADTDTDGMPCGGAGLGKYGGGTQMQAVADYLGLTLDQLRDRMHDGQSLADIAKAQGKSLSGLRDAVLAAMQKRLAADTSLTPQQRTTLLDRMRSRLDTMLTSNHMGGLGGPGMMGGRGGRGMMN